VKLGANNLQEAFNAAKWKKSKNQLAKLMQRIEAAKNKEKESL